MTDGSFVLPLRQKNLQEFAVALLQQEQSSPHRSRSVSDSCGVNGKQRSIERISSSLDQSPMSSSLHNRSPLVSPATTGSQGGGLPPTPPSTNSQDLATDTVSGTERLESSNLPLLLVDRPSLNTPVNQRSPPTPDPSPPRSKAQSIRNPEHPPTIRYPSSRAESFQTAREEPWSTNSEASRSQQSVPDSSSPFVQDMLLSPMPGTTEVYGSEIMAKTGSGTNLIMSLAAAGTGHRRGKSYPLEQRATEASPKSNPSPLKRDFSTHKKLERVKEQPRVSSSGNDSIDSNWPNEVDSMLNNHLRDGEGKRNSTASSASTVVEAVVVITPPRRRQILRHAGRNLALRESGESVSSSPATLRSQRVSLNSDDSSLHRLVHKTRLPERRNRESTDSEMSIASAPATRPASSKKSEDNAPSLPVSKTTKKTNESSLRPRAVTSPLNKLYPSPLMNERGPKGYFDIPRREEDPSSPTSTPLIQYISPYSQYSSPRVLHKQRIASAPFSTTARREYPWDRASQSTNSRPSTSHHSTYGHEDAIARIESATRALTVETRAVSAPLPEFLRSAPKGTSSFLDSPVPSEPHTPPQSDHTFLHSPALSERAESPDLLSAIPAVPNSPGSSRRLKRVSMAPTEDIPRRSSDSSRNEDQRMSVASSLRTDEHALARHLFAQNTPFSFSQFSATPDALEVSEATAISIYPHNNHSLLVVQQAARSNTNGSQYAHRLIERGNAEHTQPTLVVEPSTPPLRQPSSALVDSPLKNPRKPPVPPEFKIIPPTPADELDRQLVNTSSVDTRPARRISLKERARRYSDNFIVPLLPSKGRRTASNPPIRRIPSVAEQEGNLHPFWRPRGFWNDMEESSDDSDDYEDDDVLPAGGDTSNVVERKNNLPFGRRLSNGFRGTGGFSLGNSLGLDRAGTNKRRHYISVPANFRPRGLRNSSTLQTSHPALNPLGRVEKRLMYTHSNRSLSNASQRISRWRKVHRIPGFRMNIQYVGFHEMRDRLKERRAEKRKQMIRDKIGPRLYIEGARVA